MRATVKRWMRMRMRHTMLRLTRFEKRLVTNHVVTAHA